MRTHPRLLAGIWLAALVGFIVVGALAASNDTFPADIWLAHRLQEVDSDGFARGLDWTEDLADLPLYAAVCVGASLAVLTTGDRFGALLMLLSPAGRALNNWALKVVIERPRPSAEIVEFENQPDSFSFPSGHAEAAMVLYGLILYFGVLHIHDRRMRLALLALCMWAIIVSGIERVYAGHHWPSDVLGGYYIGVLILAGIIAVHQAALRRRSNLAPRASFTRAATTVDPE